MSTQRGNTSRTRPQKHKNRTVFKNNLHDTSQRTKLVNSLKVSNVCLRCKEIIDWKIKYKKYKPLTQPKTCVKCSQKTVKQAYHVMCTDCGKKLGVCTKCCQSKEIVEAAPDEKEQLKLDSEMKAMLQSLPERKRRSFIRYMNKKSNCEATDNDTEESRKDELMSKLNSLKISEEDDDDDLDFDDSDYNSSEGGEDD